MSDKEGCWEGGGSNSFYFGTYYIYFYNLMRAVMGSQWREMKSGVTRECLGRLKTRQATVF